jgi:CBS domain-containing protein
LTGRRFIGHRCGCHYIDAEVGMLIGGVMKVSLATLGPDDTAARAVERMLADGIGSVLVCEGTRLVGIFTERDVLRLVGEQRDFAAAPLREVMTERPVTLSAEDGILPAARLMGERGIRHLPVVEGENLVGIVSIRDVLGFLLERAWRMHDDEARETAQALLSRP